MQPTQKTTRYRYKVISCTIAITFMFGGCVPKIEKATAVNRYDIKDEIAKNLPKAVDTNANLNRKWWEAYKDEQLNQIIEKAISKAPSIKSVEARYIEANAVVEAAKANAMPQFYALNTLSRERFSPNDFLPPPFGGEYYSRYQTGVSMEYEFDFWHKRDFEISMGENIALSKQASSNAAKLALSHAICSLYIEWNYDEARIDTLAKESKLTQEQLDVLRVKNANGLADERGIVRLKIKQEKISASILTIRRNIVSKKEAICILAGEHPSFADKIQKPQINSDIAVPIPKEIYLDAISNRPDISTQKWIVSAKADKIEIQKTKFYPNINLSSFLGVNSLDLLKFLDASSYAPKIQSAISLPIFDWGKRDGELKESVSDYNAAVYDYNTMVISAANEIVGILKKLRFAENELHIATQESEHKIKLENIEKSRLKAGLEDKIGYVSSKIDTLDSRLTEISALETNMLLQISLIKALGGGYASENQK